MMRDTVTLGHSGHWILVGYSAGPLPLLHAAAIKPRAEMTPRNVTWIFPNFLFLNPPEALPHVYLMNGILLG